MSEKPRIFVIGAIWLGLFVGASVLGQEAGKSSSAQKATVASEDAQKRIQSQQNLKKIGVAIQSWHDVFDRFPTNTYGKNGKPLLSWRVEILPYVDAADLYYQFHLDEPWDSDQNRRLISKMPDVFRAPGVDEREKTVYLAPVGPKALFPRDKSDARKPHEAPRSTIGNEARVLQLEELI